MLCLSFTMKLKPVLSTLRERKRYLAFEVIAEKELSWHAIQEAIKSVLLLYSGIQGVAASGLVFVKNNKNKGIVRVAHTYVQTLRQAILFIQKIENIPVIVKSRTVSGVLNKAVKDIA